MKRRKITPEVQLGFRQTMQMSKNFACPECKKSELIPLTEDNTAVYFECQWCGEEFKSDGSGTVKL